MKPLIALVFALALSAVTLLGGVAGINSSRHDVEAHTHGDLAGPEEPGLPLVSESVWVAATTKASFRDLLPHTTLYHPITGELNLRMVQDETPVIAESIIPDGKGGLIVEHPDEYLVSDENSGIMGRITFFNAFATGILYEGDARDVKFHAVWDSVGTTVTLTGTTGTHFISKFEEIVRQIIPNVGISDGLQSVVDTEIRVKLFHEDETVRSNDICSYANDRIFADETTTYLTCSLHSTTMLRHDQSGTNAYDNWQDFLDDYYNGLHSYESSADSFNDRRLVAFLSRETSMTHPILGNVNGVSRLCESDWTSTSRSDPCGHLGLKKRSGSYIVHTEQYQNGQTYAHEIIHLLNAVGTGTEGHDDSTKSASFTEGCISLTERNVFYYTGGGNSCNHRHYWITGSGDDIESQVESGAADHAAFYP